MNFCIKICRSVATLACCVPLLALEQSSAQSVPSGEYEVKAAFLYNFIKFVDWRPGTGPAAGQPYIIGLAGNRERADLMVAILRGKSIGNHGIDVRHLSENATDAELSSCHVLFTFSNDAAGVERILSATRSASLLTVGESPGFAEAGGVIGFRIINENVRFEINAAAAKEKGLTISSKLLMLATSVITGRPTK